MDSVRFGRALGIGARSAAKALAGAVDAAAAPNPTPPKPRPTTPAPAPASTPDPPPNRPIANAARTAARATMHARKASEGVTRGGKRFGGAIWGPFVKLSGVLWLEISGAFFGIFALFAGQAVWTHRADFRAKPANHDAHLHALVFLAMALVFGYFCVSNFVRARLRERRR
jgi:hypothetical protein